MAGSITLNLNRNPESDLLESDPLPTPPVTYEHEFYFNNGDTFAKNSNGMEFEVGTRTIEAAPGGESGGRYYFAGNPDPTADSSDEQRFSFPELSEMYIKRRIYIPADYYQRRILSITVSTSIAGWQVGHVVRGVDGISTGTITYIFGNIIYLSWAANDIYNEVWVGIVTNVNLSDNAVSTNRARLDTGHKHFVLWSDGYSGDGESPTLVFGLTPSDTEGVTNINFSVAVDGSGTGQLTNTASFFVPFLTSADLGKWIDIVYYIKMATDENTDDGIIRVWKRIDGESNYTIYLDSTNPGPDPMNPQFNPGVNLGPRAAATPPYCKFKEGYCFGYANAGYPVNTTFYEAEFLVSADPIDGVSV